MARLPSASKGQSHRSGRSWGSWPLLPGWGLGHSSAKEWWRPQSSATMAAVVFLVFLFSAGVKGDEGVPAPAGAIGEEGVPAGGVHGRGGRIKIEVPTYGADATYMRRLAAATGADRALNWYGDPCYKNWAGINCDGNGRVVGINASAQGLGGWVPSTEGDGALAWLTDLDLRFNELSGPLPVLSLPRLNYLYLDGNLFTSMPRTFFSNLTEARIILINNNTRLEEWDLPADLRSLTKLWKFQARDAGISGHLLGALGRTGVLDLANNHLTGPVPETFASPSMQRLDLSNNRLNGSISFIENLPGVAEIRLDNNDFSGLLPDLDEQGMLPVVFSVAHNHLTGVVPASLTRILSACGLSVSLSGNLLQGPVPVFTGPVQTDVTEAARTGSFCQLVPGPCDPDVDALLSIAMALHFPVSLAESWKRDDPCAGWIGVHCAATDKDKDKGRRRVTGINLSRMSLNGTIHPAFASLRSLETILLTGNNISGAIPPVLTQLPSLRLLDVSDNRLNGSLPRFGRGVEVWAEGNPGLNVSSASPPSMSEHQRFAVVFGVVAVLVLVA